MPATPEQDTLWNPEDMAWADRQDETTVVLNRGIARMTSENRQKLLDMARIMFKEDFDDEGTKR